MKKVVTIGAVVVIILVGIAAYAFLKTPEEASGPIETVPLEIEPTVETAAEAPEAEAEMVDTEASPASSGAGLTTFQISQDDSTVRFELDEDLRGEHITVVGTTNQVSGEIAVDANDLSTTQVGIIQINARTLTTDSSFRNRAINNRILNTDQYEFITFAPTAVTNLPDSVGLGEPVQFTIVGDLTIRDITNEVAFTVTASFTSETELVGTASVVITREAYNLVIPSVENVTNVEEEVELYIDFTANAS